MFSRNLFGLLAPGAFLVVFFFLALSYASEQSLWVDEATQLAGVRLSFADQLRWLAGSPIEGVRVPHDRNPPLSYWLGKTWSSALGHEELTMRMLGIAAVLVGLALLYATVSASFNRVVGLICLAFCSLSPGLVVQATEIRPYPLFFLFSVILLDAFFRFLRNGASAWNLAYLYGACVAVTFTHYFGMLFSCCVLLVLFVKYRFGTSAFPALLLAAAGAYAMTSLLLLPFITAAARMTDDVHALSTSDYITRVARLAYRMVAHQAMSRVFPGDVLASLAAFALVALALRRTSTLVFLKPVAGVLIAGFAVAILAAWAVKGFDALSPAYNLWMLPLVAICVAGGAASWASLPAWSKWLPLALFAFLLGIAALGDLELVRRGKEFGHTRSEDLRRIVASLGVDNVAIVYLNPAGKTFFPLHYWFGAALNQYVISNGSYVSTLSNRREHSLPQAEYLIVAATLDLRADELRRAITRGAPLRFPQNQEVVDSVLRTHTVREQVTLLAFEALQLAVYAKKPAESAVSR